MKFINSARLSVPYSKKINERAKVYKHSPAVPFLFSDLESSGY